MGEFYLELVLACFYLFYLTYELFLEGIAARPDIYLWLVIQVQAHFALLLFHFLFQKLQFHM